MRLTVVVLRSARPLPDDWLPGIREILGKDVPVLLAGVVDPSRADDTGHQFVSLIPSLTGTHLLVLRSGDSLHKEALTQSLDLLRTAGGDSTAILGSFVLRPSPHSHPGLVREMMAFAGDLTLDDFLLAEVDRPFAVPISGIIVPVSLLRRSQAVLKRHAASPWFATMLLTLPGTERILQPPGPLVTTDLPRDPESSLSPDDIARAEYLAIQASVSRDSLVTERLLGEAAALLARSPGLVRLARTAAVMVSAARWQGATHGFRLARHFVSEIGTRAGFPQGGVGR